jgi:Xaa-Pro aminopeptidase
MPVAGRAKAVRAGMTEAGVDALVVTDRLNVRYLTGFSGSAGFVVLTPSAMTLITDGRYEEQAGVELDASGGEGEVQIGLTEDAQRELATKAIEGVTKLGIEADDVSWTRQQAFASTWFPDTELVPTSQLIEAVRAVKDHAEVARIERACLIADAALVALRPLLEHAPSEQDVAAELDHLMRRGGAEDSSFPTIVASGPNSARPHHRPGPRILTEGDMVVFDFGALVDGYASDMTRTFVLGEPTDRQRQVFDVVTAAQAAGVAAVATGVATVDVDQACRAVIADAGLGDHFTHGTGHGVGLAIHEIPYLGKTSKATLQTGNVVTVEPGVYIAGFGGVRVEDSVLVTAHGCRPLTLHPKDF